MILYRAVFPIVFLVYLFIGSLASKKFRMGIRLRKQRLKPQFIPKLKSSFWIHASSGEYEYARPLIAELKKTFPDTPIVVSFFSPTYSGIIDKDPLVDHSLPLPFDLPGPVISVISRLNPKAFFIARTDLWPELLTQLRRKNVPCILFSYFQSTNKNLISQIFRNWTLSKLSHIDCVDQSTAEQLSNIANVTSFGDTRFDRVAQRKASPKVFPFEILQRNVIVLGSTWKEDENVILPALDKTKDLWDLVIIAPHEPKSKHLQNLQNQLNQMGLSHELFSQLRKSPEAEVLLVDQTGWLFDLYRLAGLSFVGGSFKGSVHSVMEPLSHGSRTFLGPFYKNNSEAAEFNAIDFKGARAVEILSDSKGVEELIRVHFSMSEGIQSELKQFIASEVERRSGASKKLIEHLTSAKLI